MGKGENNQYALTDYYEDLDDQLQPVIELINKIKAIDDDKIIQQLGGKTVIEDALKILQNQLIAIEELREYARYN